MAQSGIVRLLALFTIFFNNEFVPALAGGHGDGGGHVGDHNGGNEGGYAGGYGGVGFSSAFSGSYASSSAGVAGINGNPGNTVLSHNNAHTIGQFQGNPFLPMKGSNQGNGQGDPTVSIYKEVNLNGIKEGVHNILGGILGSVSQLGDAIAQGGKKPSNVGGVVGCHSGKCQNNPTGSIGNSAAGSGSSAFSGSSFVGFEVSNSGRNKNQNHHHTHHTFSPDVSSGPQIREQQPNNGGHVTGDVSIGKTFGINNAASQNPIKNNVEYPYGNSNENKHNNGASSNVVIHKEITLGSPSGFGNSYSNIGFNAGHDALNDKKINGCSSGGSCNDKGTNGNLNGNIGCTSGSCGEPHTGGAIGAVSNSNSNAGAHSGIIGIGLGNIVLGAAQGNAPQNSYRPGCSDQSCGNASPHGNYSYNYSYSGSSSYATSYATSYSSSSAANSKHGD